VTAVSCRTHGIRQDATRSSAPDTVGGILPGRASLVTAGCEAPGTSVSFIPIGMATEPQGDVATASTEAVEGSDCVVRLTYVNR